MPLDRTRLLKLLGMMGSTNPDGTPSGEAVNAAAMANRLVREAGKTWEEVLNESATAGPQITKNDLAYAYQRGHAEGYQDGYKEGSNNERALSHSKNNRRGQEWRDFAKEVLASHMRRITPTERDVLEKFLAGGWTKPTPRQMETFYASIANKCDLELPEDEF